MHTFVTGKININFNNCGWIFTLGLFHFTGQAHTLATRALLDLQALNDWSAFLELVLPIM